MNTQATGKICPKSSQEQSRIEESFKQATQELSHIERISANYGETLAFSIIFQHSQAALNALHDLKNLLGIVTTSEGTEGGVA